MVMSLPPSNNFTNRDDNNKRLDVYRRVSSNELTTFLFRLTNSVNKVIFITNHKEYKKIKLLTHLTEEEGPR